jgi:hypothetical protein
MDPGSRLERDPRSGAQQQTSDELGTGGRWDNPASRGQGQWQGKSRLVYASYDNFYMLTI